MPPQQDPTVAANLAAELKSADDAIQSVISQINQNEASGKPMDVKAARAQLSAASANIKKFADQYAAQDRGVIGGDPKPSARPLPK